MTDYVGNFFGLRCTPKPPASHSKPATRLATLYITIFGARGIGHIIHNHGGQIDSSPNHNNSDDLQSAGDRRNHHFRATIKLALIYEKTYIRFFIYM
jgi:hypothetical protein